MWSMGHACAAHYALVKATCFSKSTGQQLKAMSSQAGFLQALSKLQIYIFYKMDGENMSVSG